MRIPYSLIARARGHGGDAARRPRSSSRWRAAPARSTIPGRAASTPSRCRRSAASRSRSRCSGSRGRRACCPGPARLLELRPLLGLTLAASRSSRSASVDDLRGALAAGQARRPGAARRSCSRTFGYGVPLITNPFGGPFAPGVLDLPLTVAWVVIVINAINLIDGLDGLASGVVLIASMTLWWVGAHHTATSTSCSSRAPDRRRHARIPALQLPARARLHGRHRQPFPRARAGRRLAAREPQGHRHRHAAVPAGGDGAADRRQRARFRAPGARRQPVFPPPTRSTSTTGCCGSASRRARAVRAPWYLCASTSGVMAVVLSGAAAPLRLAAARAARDGALFAFEVLEFIDRRNADSELPAAPREPGRSRAARARPAGGA